MQIVLAAGGTGGHIFPAIAVSEALGELQPACRVAFVGTGGEIEKKLASTWQLDYRTIHFRPFIGRGKAGAAAAVAALPAALRQTTALYRALQPNLVMGFGGYPSFVPVLAARLLGIPAIIQEQNIQAGFANRFLSVFASEVYAVHGAIGFPLPGRVHYVSNPVRRAFSQVEAWRAPQSGEPLSLLVVGGSQGAVKLNEAVLSMLPALKGFQLRVTHQTGALDLERVRAAYAGLSWIEAEVQPFIDNMAAAYNGAHLVISRAGALSVAEVSAAGRPAIYVPLPIAGGHQAKNAARAVASGAALLFEQSPSLANQLTEACLELFRKMDKLASMARAAREASTSEGRSAAGILAERALALAK